MKLLSFFVGIFYIMPSYAIAQVKVPVLCYHNISLEDEGPDNLMHIKGKSFDKQMKCLYDSGYHTILPDQLYNYYKNGTSLPSKPVVITFDDSHDTHFTVAAPVLKKYGFKGIFFVMTVPIGKKGYMTADQIKMLADMGHVIGCHTWDHPHLKGTSGLDVEKEIRHPKQVLEKITGQPVQYFAYPFGEWNETVIGQLKVSGFKAAFRLTGKNSEENGIFTIERIMVDGSWVCPGLPSEMKRAFK